VAAVSAETEGYDALLWPTVAIVPPPIAALDDTAEYARVNALVLRNTSAVNIMDGCALSVPMAAAGGAPAGLMIVGRALEDARVLRIGTAVEALLTPAG
jgi:aspartyl-tRNA(Asn)/glutamyl-tRNA(Gln) amidotransferase subunit A